MNLQTLTDEQLHTSTVSTAKREREETITLLKHLSEVERRHLFSKFKCDSLQRLLRRLSRRKFLPGP